MDKTGVMGEGGGKREAGPCCSRATPPAMGRKGTGSLSVAACKTRRRSDSLMED